MMLSALRSGSALAATTTTTTTTKIIGSSLLRSPSLPATHRIQSLSNATHGRRFSRTTIGTITTTTTKPKLLTTTIGLGARRFASGSGGGHVSNCANKKSVAGGSSSHSRMRSVRSRRRSKPCSSSSSSKSQHPQQRRQKATLASKESSSSSSSSKTWSSSSARLWFGRLFRFRRLPTQRSIHRWLNEPRQIPLPRWISPRMMTIRYSECFGHGSFLLVAISYALDDFLQLRLVAIAGSTAMLVFAYFHPHGRTLWLPFRWNCVFVALNSWRVANVLLDRYRSGQLSADLERIYDHHFYVLEKANFARLVRLGTLETYREGDKVLEQGQDNRWVRLVVSGNLEVDRDGQVTYYLHEGQFLSEMGLHAGLGLRGSVTSCCGVTAASETVTLVAWDRTELMHLLDLHASIERALKAVLSWDIVSKLKSQRVLLASGHVHDAETWTIKRREQSLARYEAILRNMLAHPQYLNARKERLAKYREIHQVSDEDHSNALARIGWTEPEFESGIKEGQLDEDVLERERLGFRWWIQSWWNAL